MALTKIFDMAYEVDGDGITIEQDVGCGEVSSVILHPIHVRLLAGELGLMKGDPDAWRLVESLTRKLNVLKGRCEHLENWLFHNSDTEHADLSYEQAFAEATADLAREFCAELQKQENPDETQGEPTGNPVGNPGANQATPRNATERHRTPEDQPGLALEVVQ